ncbi:MAG: DUF1858 domain-containing protein [Candidatus Kerfeldbacteria bacterium]
MVSKIKVIITKKKAEGKISKKKSVIKSKTKNVVKTKKSKKDKITKDILMGELVSKYPQTSEVLMQYGLHCVGCMLSPYESLEAGVSVHGISLKPLLKDLNKVITKTK